MSGETTGTGAVGSLSAERKVSVRSSLESSKANRGTRGNVKTRPEKIGMCGAV